MGDLAPTNSALDLAIELYQTASDLPILPGDSNADKIGADVLVAVRTSEIVRRSLKASDICAVLWAGCCSAKIRSADYNRNAIPQY